MRWRIRWADKTDKQINLYALLFALAPSLVLLTLGSGGERLLPLAIICVLAGAVWFFSVGWLMR